MVEQNGPTFTKDVGFLVKNFPQKEIWGPNDFIDEFYHIFKKEIIQFYTNSFRKFRKSKYFTTHPTNSVFL